MKKKKIKTEETESLLPCRLIITIRRDATAPLAACGDTSQFTAVSCIDCLTFLCPRILSVCPTYTRAQSALNGSSRCTKVQIRPAKTNNYISARFAISLIYRCFKSALLDVVKKTIKKFLHLKDIVMNIIKVLFYPSYSGEVEKELEIFSEKFENLKKRGK